MFIDGFLQQDPKVLRQGLNASLIGLALQFLVAAIFGGLALWSGQATLTIVALWSLGGLLVWVSSALIYQQHRLERRETLEIDELRRNEFQKDPLFAESIEGDRLQRKRLSWFYSKLQAIVSLVLIIYLSALGIWALSWGSEVSEFDQNSLSIAFTASGIAFIAFVFSRYVAGMSQQSSWTTLRAGATYMMVTAGVSMAVAIAFFLLEALDSSLVLVALERLLPLILLLFSGECALHLLLDLYRRRTSDTAPRPAFDSRLFALFTRSASLSETFSDALSYQLGFELKDSWFYRLQKRASLLLLGLGIASLLLLSSIVIVGPREAALVTRLGSIERILDPGLHWKLPWPLSRVSHYDVTSVREIHVGSDVQLKEDTPILWSNEHTIERPEPMIVAASETAVISQDDNRGGRQRSPVISLVNAEITVHCSPDRNRLLDFVNAVAGDESASMRRLKQLARRQVSRYLLLHDLDDWIGRARVTAGEELRSLIQAATDEASLGWRILNVSVASIHPPIEVADSFHAVVSAEQERETSREMARAKAISILSNVAGDVQSARRISKAVQGGETEHKIEEMILGSGGEAAEKIARARAPRWQQANRELGRVERFNGKLLIWNAAPNYYRSELRSDAISEVLAPAEKTILFGHFQRVMVEAGNSDSENAFDAIIDGLEETTGDSNQAVNEK